MIDMEEEWERQEVRDEDKAVIDILLRDAPLTGCERDQLEEVLEMDEFKKMDRERFQQLINQHIHTIHAAQRNGSHFA